MSAQSSSENGTDTVINQCDPLFCARTRMCALIHLKLFSLECTTNCIKMNKFNVETKIPLKMHVVRLVNDENQTVNTTLNVRLRAFKHMHRAESHGQKIVCILIRLTMIVMQIVKLRFNIYFNFCCDRRADMLRFFVHNYFIASPAFNQSFYFVFDCSRTAVCYQCSMTTQFSSS